MTTRIGLTGGIACGKSEVQRVLLDHGVPVLDTDRVAHEAMRPGTDTHRQVVQAFGESILAADGSIDRSRLGGIVFRDPQARERLNRLVHPEVGRQWRAWLAEREEPLAVVSIPLLFECGLENEFDGVLCVWAPETLMKQRLRGRGLTAEQAGQRIRSQMPVDRKAARATWTLKNDRTLSHLRTRVEDWLQQRTPQENP